MVAAGQVYRSQRGRLVRVIAVRGLRDRYGAYVLAQEITRTGKIARGDRDGVPRDVLLRVPLVWSGGEPCMPPGYDATVAP